MLEGLVYFRRLDSSPWKAAPAQSVLRVVGLPPDKITHEWCNSVAACSDAVLPSWGGRHQAAFFANVKSLKRSK